ncbi:MAG TPA: SCE4755 family polysaccharide monooxygenase-like protein [Nannocystaceae bacterium]|nr:SCE4755 family polysaccharide monooxygenase-like protein [Nannocystaceae bacterium]
MALSTGSPCVPAIVALGASLFLCDTADAHFVLTSPEAMYEQSVLGDPQKAPPCGDNGMAVPSGVVTPYQAGETITLTIEETVAHPGHFRIALAIDDPSQLPPEPPVTAGDTDCGSVPIDPAPAFPVLADGVLVHTEGLDGPQQIDVTLPDDISCTNCTLQIIQFMSNHGLNNPGGCFYHHCAAISIEGGAGTATSSAGDDSGGESSDGGPSTVTNATTLDDGSSSAEGGGGSTDAGDTMADDDGTGTGAISTTVPGEDDDDDAGCGCSVPRSRDPLLLGLVGLMWLGVRRRRRS